MPRENSGRCGDHGDHDLEEKAPYAAAQDVVSTAELCPFLQEAAQAGEEQVCVELRGLGTRLNAQSQAKPFTHAVVDYRRA